MTKEQRAAFYRVAATWSDAQHNEKSVHLQSTSDLGLTLQSIEEEHDKIKVVMEDLEDLKSMIVKNFPKSEFVEEIVSLIDSSAKFLEHEDTNDYP